MSSLKFYISNIVAKSTLSFALLITCLLSTLAQTPDTLNTDAPALSPASTITMPADTSKQETKTDPKNEQEDSDEVKGMGQSYENSIADPGSSNSWNQAAKPDNIKEDVEISRTLDKYKVSSTVGDSLQYKPTSEMNFQEFAEYQRKKQMREYWDKATAHEDNSEAEETELVYSVKGKNQEPLVEIRPSGNVTLEFGGKWQYIDNPAIQERFRRTGGFEFDQQISLNLLGNIGDRVSITANWDTKAAFDFDNNIKVSFLGKEEDIIKDIQVGNISFPVENSQLISGAQNLFGVKTHLQFGRLSVRAVVASQRGTTETMVIRGGAQNREFEKKSSEYDYNRHFFLSQFFRDNFAEAFNTRPDRPNNGIRITRVEVYITNTNSTTEGLRNIVGLMDLGEGAEEHIFKLGLIEQDQITNHLNTNIVGPLPNNEANSLWERLNAEPDRFRDADQVKSALESIGLESGLDFELNKNARQLEQGKDFSFHPDLGYISLTSRIQNNEGLAVAFEYTYNGQNFKVGELSEDYASFTDEEVLHLKLLKPLSLQPKITPFGSSVPVTVPTWDLMMKNIYAINSGNLQREGFQMRVIYRDDYSGQDNPNFQEGGNLIKNIPIVSHLGLDNFNRNGDRAPDGNFDFLPDATINLQRGYIIFPSPEPFGSDLRNTFEEIAPDQVNLLESLYIYDALYSETQRNAQYVTAKDKYVIKGSYQSASTQDIMLPGINIAENSVQIKAGNIPLREGSDFTVDYSLGRVKITNTGALASGKDIVIRYEKGDIFQSRPKSLMGTRLDYKVGEDFNLGGTLLYMNEQPQITRINIGDEPTKNTQIGFDINYKDESRLLTKMVDFLPVIQTKAKSTVQFNAEVAALLPGNSRFLGDEGTAYLDDFEGAETPYDFSRSPQNWRLGSTPRGLATRDEFSDSLQYNFHRALLSWYVVDNTFYNPQLGSDGFNLPSNESGENDEAINHYVRTVQPQEIFPPFQNAQPINTQLSLFDMAYYPEERGPYNYNMNESEVEDNTGHFINPENNWAAITRPITFETDFTKANIEYIEFWVMNPFHSDESGIGASPHLVEVLPDETDKDFTIPEMGGSLYFNLGDVSEDVIRDGEHGFENGLGENVKRTTWGQVTTESFITNAFDESADNRAIQDVGYDGIDDNAERSDEWFQPYLERAEQKNINSFLDDPSSDNFTYYNSFGEDEIGILTRYKRFNNTENNSPVSGNSITESNYNTPDNEDLNNDKNVTANDNYFEYKFDLRPSLDDNNRWGLNPENNPFIVGTITGRSTGDGQEAVEWYQVRIPVRNGGTPIGSISDFTTIKFFRMYMTGFKHPIVLRMAHLQLIGSQWQRYTFNSLKDDAPSELDEEDYKNFVFNTVSIEENSAGVEGQKSPYVLPPGVIRDIDRTSTNNKQNNEQALQVCVDDLEDGEGRAVMKLANYGDLISYKRLNLFIHAESPDDMTSHNDMTAFIRLGKDDNQNYYEIEVPLQFTEDLSSNDPEVVWREENEIDIPLEVLSDLKLERDRNRIALGERYSSTYGNYTIYIKGRPNRAEFNTWLLGIKNPAKKGESDDGMSKSACVWFNELRVTGFDKFSGYAATSGLRAQLADLGTVNGNLNYSGAGYGDIESNIAERSRENVIGYGVQTNIALDKFIPKNKVIGIKLPLFASLDKEIISPRFNPFDPDVLMSDAIDLQEPGAEREEFKKQTVYTKTVRSINLTGVQLEKVKKDPKKHFYDPHNIVVSAGYSEETRNGAGNNGSYGNSLDSYLRQNYQGTANYAYTTKSKSITPFKKSKLLKAKYLKLIKDFNFNPVPSSFSVKGNINRNYIQSKYRDEFSTTGFTSYYEKSFTFDRNYSVRWGITKSINLGFTATANSLIDEPFGDKYGDPERVNNSFYQGYVSSREEYKDSIRENLLSGGRMKGYQQNVTASYKLPLSKIPLINWINADINYKAGYNWTASAFNLVDSEGKPFGHLISNNNNISFNGKLNFVKLYNKSKFLKSINSPSRKRKKSKPKPKKKDADGEKSDEDKEKEEEEKKEREFKAVKHTLRALMLVRNVNGKYSINNNLTVPGFLPEPEFLGMAGSNQGAPGLLFTLGDQSIASYKAEAVKNGWVSQSQFINDPILQVRAENLNLKGTLEPFKNFRIQVDLKYKKSQNYSEIFRASDSTESGYAVFNPVISGGLEMSYITARTAFINDGRNNVSPLFENFSSNRFAFQEFLNSEAARRGQNGIYGINSQDVLIPAFIAAYSGIEISSSGDISTELSKKAPNIPLPNWRVDYAGLSRLPKLKKKFSSININHAYSSSYGITSYTSSLEYENFSPSMNINTRSDENLATNDEGEFIPIFVINEVSIQERFSPLIGINVRTKSKINIRVEFKKSRLVTLNLNNAQITEVKNNDFVFGFGYTKKKFVIPFIKPRGVAIELPNNITFKADFTIRDAKTIQRTLETETNNALNEVTAGNLNIQIRPNITYEYSKRLNIQLYFERSINDPYVTSSFRRATTAFGVKLRFSLT